jgi:putative transposase
MLIEAYSRDELRFTYCYRLYLRWRTHYAKPCEPLARLDRAVLEGIASEFGIRVLESASDRTDLLALVSLKPDETISGCVGKLKGRVSKWLREALQLPQPEDLLSRGYFACTVGKSSSEVVERYLSQQSEHHGYDKRVLPPVHVESFNLSAADEARVSPKHAAVIAQFHLVLATYWRRGVFGPQEGRAVTAEWLKSQTRLQMALLKASFLPDHVHIALRAHPSASPAELAVELMNIAQQVVFERFPDAVIQARAPRLWQSSGYIGSYGDLVSPQIRKYIHNWAGERSSLELREADSLDLEFEGSDERETPRREAVASDELPRGL